MNIQTQVRALLLALLLFLVVAKPAFACSWWNMVCHIAKPFGQAIQELTPDVNANVQIGHKIENVDELRSLVNTTAWNIRSITRLFGHETRLTLEKAEAELAEYTRLLDSLAGKRIADLDARLQAKLLWIQQYTEQVGNEVERLIRVTSTELQTVLGVTRQEAEALVRTSGLVAQETMAAGGQVAQETVMVTSAELQKMIGAGGRVLEETITLTGEELRLSILTATGETKDIVAQISEETQSAIRTTSTEMQQIIRVAIDGLDHLINSAEGTSLRILEGTLYVVVRTADLTLAVGSTAAGLLFLFIAAYGWGRAVLQAKMPEPGLSRKFVVGLMMLTFVVAILPFGFLSKEARAYVLLPMNQATVYARVVGQSREIVPVTPRIKEFIPQQIIVLRGEQEEQKTLVVKGINLLSHGGYPTALYGEQELTVSGTDTQLMVNIEPVLAYPQAAPHLLLQFGQPSELTRKVTVFYVDTTPTPIPTTTPTATATATPDRSPRFVVKRNANLRNGPSTAYEVVGGASREQVFGIVAQSPDRQWWQICCVKDQLVWIFSRLGEAFNVEDVPATQNFPHPPVTATPVPTPTQTTCLEPSTAYFGVSSDRIEQGDEVVLRWKSVLNAESVAVHDGTELHGVNFAGELKVAPKQSTTYQLFAGYCSDQIKLLGQRYVEVIARQSSNR